MGVAAWLAVNPTGDPAAADRKYILVGDFNAYFGEDPIQALLGSAGYTNLINLLLGSQRGYLDHPLANRSALPLVKSVAHLHVNADEPAALQALDSDIKSATGRGRVLRTKRIRRRRSRSDRHWLNPLLGAAGPISMKIGFE